ncbi:MAG: YIP1 family protein [archaeon]
MALHFSSLLEILLFPGQAFHELKEKTEALDGMTMAVILFIVSMILIVAVSSLFNPKSFKAVEIIKELTIDIVFVMIFTVLVGVIAAKIAIKFFNGKSQSSKNISVSGYSQAVFLSITILVLAIQSILSILTLKPFPKTITSLFSASGLAGVLFLFILIIGVLWWLYVHGTGISKMNEIGLFNGLFISVVSTITGFALTFLLLSLTSKILLLFIPFEVIGKAFSSILFII